MYEVNKFLNTLCRTSVYPGVIILPWIYGLISLFSVKLLFFIFTIIFVIGPIIFKYSISFQRKVFFLSFLAKECNFKNPNELGLYATRNFKIKYAHNDNDEPVKLGVWHILPIDIAKKFSTELHLDSAANDDILNTINIANETELTREEINIKNEYPIVNEENEKLFYERMLCEPGIVIMYLHGNSGTRGRNHRVELYKVLRKIGYHIIAFDYRSFGDSSQISPSEDGCINDTFAVYNYIRSITKNPIFIWGHSLGSGVATHFLSIMNNRSIYEPSGVILESPFTNIKEEIRSYPMAFFFKFLPWFEATVVNPIYENKLRFESDEHICEFRQPVLILHAQDDLVVPFKLGYKLYRKALDDRGRDWGPVEFKRFSANSSYGHLFICRSPELPSIIMNFVKCFSTETY